MKQKSVYLYTIPQEKVDEIYMFVFIVCLSVSQFTR